MECGARARARESERERMSERERRSEQRACACAYATARSDLYSRERKRRAALRPFPRLPPRRQGRVSTKEGESSNISVITIDVSRVARHEPTERTRRAFNRLIRATKIRRLEAYGKIRRRCLRYASRTYRTAMLGRTVRNLRGA